MTYGNDILGTSAQNKKKLSIMKINNMESLKCAIKPAWKESPQDMVNCALESWPRRCLKIYKAKGQHIE